MKQQLVLDMDLDFFVKPIKLWAADEDPRLPEGEYTAESEKEVRTFLEETLGLDLGCPIPGKIVRHHKEVFTLWEKLIAEGRLTTPFAVIHVDAHEDVGGLGLRNRVNSENFLTHGVRKGWINELMFILQKKEIGIPTIYLKHDPPRVSVDGQEAALCHSTREDFDSSSFGRPDFFFLASSPAFTPKSADRLLSVLQEYILEI